MRIIIRIERIFIQILSFVDKRQRLIHVTFPIDGASRTFDNFCIAVKF